LCSRKALRRRALSGRCGKLTKPAVEPAAGNRVRHLWTQSGAMRADDRISHADEVAHPRGPCREGAIATAKPPRPAAPDENGHRPRPRDRAQRAVYCADGWMMLKTARRCRLRGRTNDQPKILGSPDFWRKSKWCLLAISTFEGDDQMVTTCRAGTRLKNLLVASHSPLAITVAEPDLDNQVHSDTRSCQRFGRPQKTPGSHRATLLQASAVGIGVRRRRPP